MKTLLLLLCFTTEMALAEKMSRQSGVSISGSGVQIQSPVGGQGVNLQADSSGVSMGFSLTGSSSGQYNGNGGNAPLPVQQVAPVPPSSALSNSDEFFRGVGKPDATPSPRRRINVPVNGEQ